MYESLKDCKEYEFMQFCSIEIKQKYGYSIFEIKRKESKTWLKNHKFVPKLDSLKEWFFVMKITSSI